MPRFACGIYRFLLLVTAFSLGSASSWGAPHAVLVVGTHHYSPQETLPPLAEQLERVGFRTTVVAAAQDPEHDEAGLPGLEALEHADVAIFFLRFLTLPDAQLAHLKTYLARGGAVVALRTSSHAFDYPPNDPRAVWNQGFGRRVMGTGYRLHLKGSTKIARTGSETHPIFTGVDTSRLPTAAGTLYLASLPADARVLLEGTGRAKRTGVVKNRFGTHRVTAEMTQPVAWTWENEWGGRVFGSTLGHPRTLMHASYVRLLINATCWAAQVAVPPADTPVGEIRDGKLTQPARARRRRKADATSPESDPEYGQYAIFAETAKRPSAAPPRSASLPLSLEQGERIAFIGNTLLDRTRHFGYLESFLHAGHPDQELVVRNLSWPADTPSAQPRPLNFADLEQHLTHVEADVILAAFGFNESFAGPGGLEAFRQSLTSYVEGLRSKAFRGTTGSRVVLLSPIANENIAGVPAADMNNANLRAYTDAMAAVCQAQEIGFIDCFTPLEAAMRSPDSDLTVNGAHLNDAGYRLWAHHVYRALTENEAPEIPQGLRESVIDKNRQFFRRYRPANTFYYTGGRNKQYGYLDFLPAMKNFELMVTNRDERIWQIAQGHAVPDEVDDTNVPELPTTRQSRGANEWLSAEDERAAFRVDERFDVQLFASEEQFPELGAPIQMRWDAKGRLWVSCSTTYPHVYPGAEPRDKLVILEDTDQDGRADRSTVFADDLHIPLSFEFGDDGVYVSEMPALTFLQDRDGDDKADQRTRLLTGFGTEDSHHALHDLTWTPDGDLIFREGIFHHSQVETPYGPIRQRNSGWFRFQPRNHQLTGFGTYHSTNPWGVTFDDWGQHVASHPIYAAAFHALDPPYPLQHPRPAGLRAYSGTCGQEFVDFPTFPAELQGGYIKVRYKPTNRVEFHRWTEGEFGFDEEYVSDVLFSSNLSFIPVDVRFGPRGALYVCDWYNPVKGHAQYSLRDDRRDRHSGRIWRITAKGIPLQVPPRIAGASTKELLKVLERPEYRYRYWAKRELRHHDPESVLPAIQSWLSSLDQTDPRYHHHQLEALWTSRAVGQTHLPLLRSLLQCETHLARAAAVEQLRYAYPQLPDAHDLLRQAVHDPSAIVRMQAAIAASYFGTREALDTLLEIFDHPTGGHLSYAITCALGSAGLRQHWEGDPNYQIAQRLRQAARASALREPSPSASQAEFDRQSGLAKVEISCALERMRFTVERFDVQPGQPVKLVFTNPDATDHNLLIVRDGALEEVGMAANEMAKDPRNANSNFIPSAKRDLIVEAAPMIGPTRTSRVHVLRFTAPLEPGIYPYVCTFPGHWVIMKGQMVVAADSAAADALVAARAPRVQANWTMQDFSNITIPEGETAVMRGMKAFSKARCLQCHEMAGHGVKLGPDLAQVNKRFRGAKLLRQIIEPSHEIHTDYRAERVLTDQGQEFQGVIKYEDGEVLRLIPNLLTPRKTVDVPVASIETRSPAALSSMPSGLLDVLTKEEVLDLLAYLEAGGYQPPNHLKEAHDHAH